MSDLFIMFMKVVFILLIIIMFVLNLFFLNKFVVIELIYMINIYCLVSNLLWDNDMLLLNFFFFLSNCRFYNCY